MKDEYDISWFFDTILFFQLSKIKPAITFQRWTLTRVKDSEMIITYFDLDGQHRLGSCPVPPNFPFQELMVVVNNEHVALASEIEHVPE